MNRNFLILIISFAFCLCTYGQTYKMDFGKALKDKDMTKAEEILKAWDYADANDSELYPCYFNFYTIKSLEKDSTVFDKAYATKALEYISEGIERFPTRFDMRVLKIYMLSHLKDYTNYTNEILKMINYSKKIDNNWKGEGFSILDSPLEIFSDAIMEFQEILYTENNIALHNNILQISIEMLKNYPKHIQSLLNVSTIHFYRKEYNKSLEILNNAVKIDPNNAILYYNLAHIYSTTGDKANAKKNYEFTVAKAKEDEKPFKDAAQKKLDGLK